MAGLYPDDEVVNVYGTELLFPGLDPKTEKFTNGDFSDPLIKPSFIPAQTINLILDNLETFISGLGLNPNNTDTDQLLKALQNKYSTTDSLMNFLFPIGKGYKQRFNDPSPLELGLPGEWEVWSDRADGYGLIFGTLPNYTPYIPGANYAIGAYVLDHVSGDDYRIFRAKEAIANATQYLDPVKWQALEADIIVERRHLQEWTDDDFVIGDEIVSGHYAGWKVSEVIVPGGKFDRVEGGFGPTFIIGGVGGEERHTLTIEEMPAHQHKQITGNNANTLYVLAAPLASSSLIEYPDNKTGIAGGGQPHGNIPPCLAVRYYRRVA